MSLVDYLNEYLHPNFNNIRSRLITCLEDVSDKLLIERNNNKSIVPETHLILKLLSQDPYGRRGVIVGLDPYPINGTGIPFQDLEYNKTSNKNIAANIARVYDIDPSMITGCGLENLIDTDGIFLINAALTTVKAPYGSKHVSGVHIDIWSEFFVTVLNYVITSSSSQFVLVFGKTDAVRNNVMKSIGENNTHVIGTYHPAMAFNFLKETCNPFQEVNAFLRLRHMEEIQWYRALNGFQDAFLEEVREAEDSGYTRLDSTNLISMDDLNSHECLLGDLDKIIRLRAVSYDKIMVDLARSTDNNMNEFKITVNNMLRITSNYANDNEQIFNNVLCGYSFLNDKLLIILNGVSYNSSIMNYFMRDRRRWPQSGYFNLAKRDNYMNSYECLIEIIHSQRVSYQILLACKHVIESITTEPEYYTGYIDIKSNNLEVCLSLDGTSMYHYDNNYFSTKIKPTQICYTNKNNVIATRPTRKKITRTDNIYNPSPLFAVVLYLYKDYNRTIKYCNTHYDADHYNIAQNMYKKYMSNTLPPNVRSDISIFHLSLCVVAKISNTRFHEIIKDMHVELTKHSSSTTTTVQGASVVNTVSSSTVISIDELNNKHSDLIDAYNSMSEMYERVVDKTTLSKNLNKHKKDIDDLTNCIEIISVVNKLIACINVPRI